MANQSRRKETRLIERFVTDKKRLLLFTSSLILLICFVLFLLSFVRYATKRPMATDGEFQ